MLASIGATAMSTDNYDEGYSILSCLLDELDSLTVAERIQAEKLLLNPGRKFDDLRYEIESSCGVACLLRALQLAQTERSSDEDIVRFLERSVEYLKSQANHARRQYYDLAKQALSQFSPAASYDATE